MDKNLDDTQDSDVSLEGDNTIMSLLDLMKSGEEAKIPEGSSEGSNEEEKNFENILKQLNTLEEEFNPKSKTVINERKEFYHGLLKKIKERNHSCRQKILDLKQRVNMIQRNMGHYQTNDGLKEKPLEEIEVYYSEQLSYLETRTNDTSQKYQLAMDSIKSISEWLGSTREVEDSFNVSLVFEESNTQQKFITESMLEILQNQIEALTREKDLKLDQIGSILEEMETKWKKLHNDESPIKGIHVYEELYNIKNERTAFNQATLDDGQQLVSHLESEIMKLQLHLTETKDRLLTLAKDNGLNLESEVQIAISSVNLMDALSNLQAMEAKEEDTLKPILIQKLNELLVDTRKAMTPYVFQDGEDNLVSLRELILEMEAFKEENRFPLKIIRNFDEFYDSMGKKINEGNLSVTKKSSMVANLLKAYQSIRSKCVHQGVDSFPVYGTPILEYMDNKIETLKGYL